MNWEAIFWLAALIVFICAEAATVTLVSIWFAVGALAAIVVALLGGGIGLQVTVFLIVATVLLISLRTVVRKYFKPRLVRTNVDSMAGKTGIVTVPINNVAALGQVTISGMEWSARSTTGAALPEGAKVRVARIEGVKVFVSLAEEPAEAVCSCQQ